MKKLLTALGLFTITAALAVSAGAAMPQEFADAGFTEKQLTETVDYIDAAIDYGHYSASDAPLKDYYEVGEGYVTVESTGGTAEITFHNANYTGSGTFIEMLVNNNFEVTLNVEGTNTFGCDGPVIAIGMYGIGLDDNTLIFSGTGSLDYVKSSDIAQACHVKVESGTYSGNYLAHCSFLDVNGGTLNFRYLNAIIDTVVQVNDPSNVNAAVLTTNHYRYYGNLVIPEDDILVLYKEDIFTPGSKLTVDGLLVFPEEYSDYDAAMADYRDNISGTGIVFCGNNAYTMDGEALPNIFLELSIDYEESSGGKYWNWNADTKTLTLDDNLVIYDSIVFYGDYEGNEVTIVVNGNVYVGEDIKVDDFEHIVLDIRGYMYVDDDINSSECTEMIVKGGGILEVDDEIEVMINREYFVSDSVPFDLPEDHEEYGEFDNYYLNEYDLDDTVPAVLTIEEDTWLLSDEELDADMLVVNGMLYVEDSSYPAVEIYHSLVIGKNGGIFVMEDPSDEEDIIIDIAFLNFWNLPENELHNLKGYDLVDDAEIYYDYKKHDSADIGYFYAGDKRITASEIKHGYTEPEFDVDFNTTKEAVISGNFITVTHIKKPSASSFASDLAAYARLLMQKYPIVLEASEGGTVTGKTAVNHNSSAVYTIKANEGYVLTELTVDGKMVELTKELTLDKVRSSHTIKAVFAPAE